MSLLRRSAVREGETIIIAAGLAGDIGTPDFARLVDETADLDTFIQKLPKPGFSVTSNGNSKNWPMSGAGRV